MISFEYPLTEKSRDYFRFELLFSHINQSFSLENDNEILAYFKSLFELIELTERNDIRYELIKDLRVLSDKMQSWLSHKEADTEIIKNHIQESNELVNALIGMSKQINFLKNSRFLTALKQRFFIPGGCCNFDLPEYHLWLAKPLALRRLEAEKWFDYFRPLERALVLFLKMKRHQGIKSIQYAKNGFFQGEVENALFIEIKVNLDLNVYPKVSGHRHRYSITFMDANAENSCNKAKVTEFEQIIC
jgi:cell division protein ZapD